MSEPKWVGSGRMEASTLFLMIACAGCVVLLGSLFLRMSATLAWLVWLLAVLLLVSTINFSCVRVGISGTDVLIRVGPFGWRHRFGLDSINEAQVREVRAKHHGWGYRALSADARAIILRSGDALLLRREKGDFLVTIDDPSEAAGSANALIETV